MESLNYLFTIAGIILSIGASIFCAGFYFNKKVKEACAEQNKELEDKMDAIFKRIVKLETECVPVRIYERDLEELKGCIKELHTDVKSGMTALTTRIDNLVNRPV